MHTTIRWARAAGKDQASAWQDSVRGKIRPAGDSVWQGIAKRAAPVESFHRFSLCFSLKGVWARRGTGVAEGEFISAEQRRW